ncbi:MAG: hypothetical protein R2867_32740 [Caldilineaceae bacterium]
MADFVADILSEPHSETEFLPKTQFLLHDTQNSYTTFADGVCYQAIIDAVRGGMMWG